MTQFSVYPRSSDALPDLRKTSALRAFVTGSGRLRPTAFLLLFFCVLGKGTKSTEGLCKASVRYALPTAICADVLVLTVLLWTISSKRLTFAFPSEAHIRPQSQERAQRFTRANRGRFEWGGAITTLGAFRVFTNISSPGF